MTGIPHVKTSQTVTPNDHWRQIHIELPSNKYNMTQLILWQLYNAPDNCLRYFLHQCGPSFIVLG